MLIFNINYQRTLIFFLKKGKNSSKKQLFRISINKILSNNFFIYKLILINFQNKLFKYNIANVKIYYLVFLLQQKN